MGNIYFIFGGKTNIFTKPDEPKNYIVYRKGTAGYEELRNGVFGDYKGSKYTLEDAIALAKALDAEYKICID